jgi:hypothetical protein
MDDVYQHAKRQLQQQAPPELITGFREQMEFIRSKFKHSARTVDSCMTGIGPQPTLQEILTAAFVVNGGVLFKHGESPLDEDAAELELNELMQEITELSKTRSGIVTDTTLENSSTSGSKTSRTDHPQSALNQTP